MATAPTGTESKLLDNLRTLVANSSSFQTWVGAENATVAKASVTIEESAPGSNRPFAIVGFDSPPEREASAGGTRNYFELRTTLWLAFEAAISDTDSPEDSLYEFTNTVGAIIGEMELLAGTGGYLNATSIRCEGIGRSDIGEASASGAFYRGSYVVEVTGVGA